MAEIAIIGGGASGMAAAIAAARNPKNHITLIERQSRVGRKLLATGNGRCNLTNTGASRSRYHGEAADFVEGALAAWPPAAVLDFFASLGLRTVTEYGGRVYPMSDHAGSVLDVLRLALEQENITVLTGCAVESARKCGSRFSLRWADGALEADRLIIACGGCAGAKLGGVMDGYTLLKSFGHSRTALYPALTPVRTVPDYPRALKGIKADAKLRLTKGKTTLAAAQGDVLFTDTGLSGTAVFDISRIAAKNADGSIAHLDFFGGMGADEILAMLRARRQAWPNLPANQILMGTVQSRLGQMLCKASGISGGETVCSISDAALHTLAKVCKDFALPVTGVSGFESAQVTAGGIKTAEFDPETMQSRLVPGLYACGEVLDIDGDCGGYNLQWAWASGLLAGGAVR